MTITISATGVADQAYTDPNPRDSFAVPNAVEVALTKHRQEHGNVTITAIAIAD